MATENTQPLYKVIDKITKGKQKLETIKQSLNNIK